MTIECLVLGMYIISIIFFRFISLSKICLARSVAGQDLCWGDNQWQTKQLCSIVACTWAISTTDDFSISLSFLNLPTSTPPSTASSLLTCKFSITLLRVCQYSLLFFFSIVFMLNSIVQSLGSRWGTALLHRRLWISRTHLHDSNVVLSDFRNASFVFGCHSAIANSFWSCVYFLF